MDICAKCGIYRKHHASADHKFVLFPTDTYTSGKYRLRMRDADEVGVRTSWLKTRRYGLLKVIHSRGYAYIESNGRLMAKIKESQLPEFRRRMAKELSWRSTKRVARGVGRWGKRRVKRAYHGSKWLYRRL